mgnify:CR=1 FL=1
MQPSETPIDATFDVVGIGNAIVDVISHESEAFLQEFELIKESMTLVDEKTAVDLYNSMSPTIQTSGGSAANTCVALSKLNVANAALRTVDFKGGLDKYLKSAKQSKLSKKVKKLKASISAKL